MTIWRMPAPANFCSSTTSRCLRAGFRRLRLQRRRRALQAPLVRYRRAPVRRQAGDIVQRTVLAQSLGAAASLKRAIKANPLLWSTIKRLRRARSAPAPKLRTTTEKGGIPAPTDPVSFGDEWSGRASGRAWAQAAAAAFRPAAPAGRLRSRLRQVGGSRANRAVLQFKRTDKAPTCHSPPAGGCLRRQLVRIPRRPHHRRLSESP
jgi:hypothetical protein